MVWTVPVVNESIAPSTINIRAPSIVALLHFVLSVIAALASADVTY